MPTVLSMFHGGICREATRARIDRAHGRASSNVRSDIGAIESGRWQASHFAWKIGATSFVKVGVGAAVSAGAAAMTDAASITALPIAAVIAPTLHAISNRIVILQPVAPSPLAKADGLRFDHQELHRTQRRCFRRQLSRAGRKL